jgi:predicted nucleotidyltransferase
MVLQSSGGIVRASRDCVTAGAFNTRTYFHPLPPTRLHRQDFLCYQTAMDRQEIIARLRENEAALKARGVTHAALFGSRARGEARPESDTDIMIEIDPAARIGVYEYVGLKEYIASLFDGPVDVVNRDGLKPYVKPAAMADAIYAF